MPIPIAAFEMPYAEFRERSLRLNPLLTEEWIKMEFANAQAGPQMAASLQQAIERRLSGVDLKANLEEARKLIDAALGFLSNNGAKQ